MKKTITCILLTAGLTGYLSAQTPVQDKSDKNSGKVIRMDKQMFLDNIFDYTSGSTNWKYKGEKPAVIDFYATWCGPCRMVAPLLKSLAKEYKDQIAVYKVDTDKQMFLDNIFDYTSGSTNWKYKGEKPAVIDFYATWCGPCRMVAPLLKSLAKEYKDQIAVYKVDTDKQKELSAVMGIQSLPTIIFIPKTGQPQIIIGAANKATFRKAIEEVLLKE